MLLKNETLRVEATLINKLVVLRFQWLEIARTVIVERGSAHKLLCICMSKSEGLCASRVIFTAFSEKLSEGFI